MTFAQYETSEYSGTPERLFLFSVGNVQYAYNNQEREIVRGSTTYYPAIIAMDNIVQNLGEGPPTVDVTMDSDLEVAQQFVPYQPIFPMKVTVFRRHRDDPDGQYVVEMMGEVAAVAFDEEEHAVVFACRMVSSNFSRKVPWPIYQKPCNYALYGAGCRVNMDDFKLQTQLTSVNETSLRAASFATKPDGWFRTGLVKRDLTGEVRFIIDHVGDELTLQTPFIDLVAGDSLTVYAGCDRSYATCRDKFNNGHRFLGFEWMPTKNPFTDNIYGTGSPAGSGGGGGFAKFIKIAQA